MVNIVGVESCRKITRHPPVGQCRRVQRYNCSYLNRECHPSSGVILFSFMEGEHGSTFYGEWTISSHKDRGR